jgi:hypothetical protein
VVKEMLSALPANTQIKCADLWLLRPPGAGALHAEIWALVCMVALEAMDYGRRAMWAMHLQGRESAARVGLEWHQITDFYPIDYISTREGPREAGAEPPGVIQRASRKAAAMFWCLLQDFVSMTSEFVPSKWMVVNPDHPYMGVVRTAGSLKMRLNLPAGFELPHDI